MRGLKTTSVNPRVKPSTLHTLISLRILAPPLSKMKRQTYPLSLRTGAHAFLKAAIRVNRASGEGPPFRSFSLHQFPKHKLCPPLGLEFWGTNARLWDRAVDLLDESWLQFEGRHDFELCRIRTEIARYPMEEEERIY